MNIYISIYYYIYAIIIFQNIYGIDIHVSKDLPVDSTSFRTIQSAINVAEPGDNIFIREGRYSEHVRIEKKKATAQNPIRIEAWPNERVVIDGTVPITTNWEAYDHNGLTIYRTSLDSAALADSMGDVFRGVWQLFLNDRMMIPAQLINLKNHDRLLHSPTWNQTIQTKTQSLQKQKLESQKLLHRQTNGIRLIF